jgi:hypothetical protein
MIATLHHPGAARTNRRLAKTRPTGWGPGSRTRSRWGEQSREGQPIFKLPDTLKVVKVGSTCRRLSRYRRAARDPPVDRLPRPPAAPGQSPRLTPIPAPPHGGGSRGYVRVGEQLAEGFLVFARTVSFDRLWVGSGRTTCRPIPASRRGRLPDRRPGTGAFRVPIRAIRWWEEAAGSLPRPRPDPPAPPRPPAPKRPSVWAAPPVLPGRHHARPGWRRCPLRGPPFFYPAVGVIRVLALIGVWSPRRSRLSMHPSPSSGCVR